VNYGTSQVGFYTVKALRTLNNCSDSAFTNFTILLRPATPTVSSTDSALARRCGPGAVAIQVNGGAARLYRRYQSLIAISPIDIGSSFTSNLGSDSAFYISEIIGNCESDRVRVPVTINTPPVVTLPNKLTIERGQSIQISGIVQGRAQTYSWSPANGLNDVQVPGPIASPTESTTYKLLVTDANGCQAADSVFVEVLNVFFVPTGFSPNDDGVNDIWNIKGLYQYPDAKVTVLNRWGQELYVSDLGYKTPWDGKDKSGNKLPASSYFYLLELGNGTKQTGAITIMR